MICLTRRLDAESARRVAEFRIEPSVQRRVDLLARRTNEGVFTDDDRAEYEALVSAADFISILKLKSPAPTEPERQLKADNECPDAGYRRLTGGQPTPESTEQEAE